ncbi:hypothetical protein PVK06_046341 [Gossypium arboreum]|uniref:Uncharacterized protein n=1 Tax=Gossypium arboreum TaxID=29729 RepID=A0ABR0MA81_GOSAR|nr:hypothetical protein PVK06_046341 [Gossypium arboreum]
MRNLADISLQQTTTHCADTPATSETPQNPSAIADKVKGKKPTTAARPNRGRRPSRFQGIGLYTNLNTGDTRRGIYELNNSSDAQSSNKKRKATGDEIGTQESVAPKK